MLRRASVSGIAAAALLVPAGGGGVDPTGSSPPTSVTATGEFVRLLNVDYHRWAG